MLVTGEDRRMNDIRQPAVAGAFYPARDSELHEMLNLLLAAAPRDGQPPPKAMIVPHAGYIYSGPVAATGYARLQSVADTVQRVIVMGPSHRVAFHGLAVTDASIFRTPLGDIALDTDTIQSLLALPQVHLDNEAHRLEHSIEVHLPFLQEMLENFLLVPIVVGDATPAEVCDVVSILWDGPETLLIVSSDLSHYHDYETATRLDRATSRAIETLAFDKIGYEHACGRNPVSGLLLYARQHNLAVETLDLRNSGDTAGPRDQVVGYGTYVINR
jgi:AmmeMemoRadiSam system protein B